MLRVLPIQTSHHLLETDSSAKSAGHPPLVNGFTARLVKPQAARAGKFCCAPARSEGGARQKRVRTASVRVSVYPTKCTTTLAPRKASLITTSSRAHPPDHKSLRFLMRFPLASVGVQRYVELWDSFFLVSPLFRAACARGSRARGCVLSTPFPPQGAVLDASL